MSQHNEERRGGDDATERAPEDEQIPGIYYAPPAAVHPDVGGDATDPDDEDMGPDLPAGVAESGPVGYGEGVSGGRGIASPAESVTGR